MRKTAIIIFFSVIAFVCISINFNSTAYAQTVPAIASLDFNGDGIVDISDLAAVSKNYNTIKTDNSYDAKYDVNGDGIIDIYDITFTAKQIGTSVPVDSVTLNKTSDTLTIKDTDTSNAITTNYSDTLTAAILPSNAANKTITWTSSNPSVAEVDTNGKITAVGAGTSIITVTTADGNKTAACNITVNNIKGYISNYYLYTSTEVNIRSGPGTSYSILGHLYEYQKVEIADTSNSSWYKINYNGGTAYVASGYIIKYTSPSDEVVNIAKNITSQFEVGTGNQIAGNFDDQGLSLGYLQWCIGQQSLQRLLNRMDRQYNSKLQNIFGTNYASLHSMIQDTQENQLIWAKSINDSNNKIIEPWYTEFVNLSKNADYISIERDAEAYTVNQAVKLICNKYNLKTIRGFALAFDIVNQNGSISSSAASTIDAAIQQNPNMTEKELLAIIANAVSGSNSDVLSRKMCIVNGQGTVHGIMLYLDRDYGLSDSSWR